MALKEQLDTIREGSAKRIPPDKQMVMKKATEDLRNSPVMGGILKVGDKMPAFSGMAQDGRTITSGDLLARGPIVASFFRGHW